MRKFLPFVLILALISLIIISISYLKSNELKSKGDLLLQENKPAEALIYYKEAHSVFPFRTDINDDINSTQLLINSQLEYSEIVDTEYAETQNIPALNEIQKPNLIPGQVLVPILMYHHIRINPKPGNPVWASLNVAPVDLETELKYLSKNNFHAISLNDLYDALNFGKSLPTKPIVLTFDDGYVNFYQNAFPLLKKYNMKAIQFVITQVETAPAYLSWDQIVELDKSGLVEIGAHTRHHPFLTDLTAASINNEIEGSKADIESHLGHAINWFAYPYGSYNNYIVSEVAKAGFKGAVSTNYSPVQSKDKLFLLNRIQVDGRFTLDEFSRRIQ